MNRDDLLDRARCAMRDNQPVARRFSDDEIREALITGHERLFAGLPRLSTEQQEALVLEAVQRLAQGA